MEIWLKIRFPLLIVLFLSGLAFIIFAVFFNHSTLSINAQAPYSVTVVDFRSFECPENSCNITLAPGKYELKITKPDYQELNDSVQLALGQTSEKSYTFQLTPKIQPIGDWNSTNIFNQKPFLIEQLKHLNLNLPSTFWQTLDNSLTQFAVVNNFQTSSSGENYLLDNDVNISLISTKEATPEITPIPTGSGFFYTNDNSKALYLANDKISLKQTLYSLDLAKRPFETTTLTTFLRAVSSYQLFPDKSFSKIALLDQSDAAQVGIYIIDLNTKTKKLIVSEQNILDFRWLEKDFLNDSTAAPSSTENQFFLIQKRNPVTLQTELYRGSLNDPTPELLSINNDLPTILPVSNHELIYAKTLSNNGFTFEKIDLNTAQSTTLFIAENLMLPSKIQYDAAQKHLLFLSDSTIYSLTLTL